MVRQVTRAVRCIVIIALFVLVAGNTALADVTANYRGKDFQNFDVSATATFAASGSVTIEVNVPTKGNFVYSGTVNGTVVEGRYTAPPGYGGGSFKANLSTAPSGNNVPASITILHGSELQWPVQLTFAPGGNGGGGGGDTPAEERPQIQASIVCDPNPLAITISELPSKTCTVWISNWKRDTSALVQVIALQARDGYGNHVNGIQVFGAGQPGSGIGVAPYNMSGFRAPDGRYGTMYPWNLTVFACPSQQGTGATCFNYAATPGPFSVPLVVHQDGAQDAVVAVTGTALSRGGAAISGNTDAARPFRIRNIWRADQFINIEQGALAASQIGASWWSAQWILEPVAGTPFVRIANRWKPGQYINIENGLAAGPAPAHWYSAMWSIEPVAGTTGAYRIRNRWKPDQFLNVENGQLQCTQILETWWSAMWSIDA